MIKKQVTSFVSPVKSCVGQTYYPALDYYYKIGETIDPSSRIRQNDQQIWKRDEPN